MMVLLNGLCAVNPSVIRLLSCSCPVIQQHKSNRLINAPIISHQGEGGARARKGTGKVTSRKC